MADFRKKYPVKIVWSPYVEGRLVPVLFGSRVQLLEHFSMYLLIAAKEKIMMDGRYSSKASTYNSTIQKKAYGLSAFAQFLENKGVDWKDVDDLLLTEFRDSEQSSIMQAKSSRTELSSKRSTNDKLRQVYRFYLWAQEEQLLIENHMGWPEAKIKSLLPEQRKDPSKFARSASLKKLLFPLSYRRVGENSRNRYAHYATDEELDDLRSYFYDSCNFETAERNVLMVDIIESVGWRQGSVKSLKTSQFKEGDIEVAMKNGDNWFNVLPLEQKGGHENTYEIPLQLAIRISRYIKKTRQNLIDLRGKNESVAKQVLFISFTTCKPLGKATISRIIASGFSAIGVQKGAGPHSLRRKFGKEKANEILHIRKKLGISMSPEDVVQDLMGCLGHSSRGAQEAYTRGKIDMYKLSPEAKLHSKLEDLKAQNAELKIELLKMRKSK